MVTGMRDQRSPVSFSFIRLFQNKQKAEALEAEMEQSVQHSVNLDKINVSLPLLCAGAVLTHLKKAGSYKGEMCAIECF